MTPATQIRLLKSLRQMLHFELDEVAEALCLGVELLQSFEAGDSLALKRKQLRQMCWCYGQEYHLLLAGKVHKEPLNREGLRLQYRNPRDWLSLSIWFRTADYFAAHLNHVAPSPIRLPFSSPEESLYHRAFYKPLVLISEASGPPAGKAPHLPSLALAELMAYQERGLLNRVELEDLLVI